MYQDRSLGKDLGFIRNERTKMRNAVLRNITVRADELARQYNKTKDPSIRDQWFKLLKQIPQDPEEIHPLFRKKTSDKAS
jgi:hypothetical protein